jgi:hypothetical protein
VLYVRMRMYTCMHAFKYACSEARKFGSMYACMDACVYYQGHAFISE